MLLKGKYCFIALILLASGFVFPQSKTELSCKQIMTKSINAIREVKTLKYHLKITERGKKGLNFYESAVKFTRQPRLIYLYIKGIEVLWLQGKNKGKALVKPNSFPFINLNLDPMGSLMRQDQHHTLNEMGFDYFGNIIDYSMIKIGDKFDDYFSIAGEERINGRPCFKILIDNKDFSYIDYLVGDDENITSIARKFYISEYMIVEKNPKLKDYFDILKKGSIVKIPNWYAKSVIVYVDQLYYLPISVKVSDETGLFEEYNYHFLQVNPEFEEGEFTRDYKEYKF